MSVAVVQNIHSHCLCVCCVLFYVGLCWWLLLLKRSSNSSSVDVHLFSLSVCVYVDSLIFACLSVPSMIFVSFFSERKSHSSNLSSIFMRFSAISPHTLNFIELKFLCSTVAISYWTNVFLFSSHHLNIYKTKQWTFNCYLCLCLLSIFCENHCFFLVFIICLFLLSLSSSVYVFIILSFLYFIQSEALKVHMHAQNNHHY